MVNKRSIFNGHHVLRSLADGRPIDLDRHWLRSFQLCLLSRREEFPGRVRGQGSGEWRDRNRHQVQGRRSVGIREAGLEQAAEEGCEQADSDSG